MLYLAISLALLLCTPWIVKGVDRFKRFSQIFALLLISALCYNIFSHILLEHLNSYGWGALFIALCGLLIFSCGDHIFFLKPQHSSQIFVVLLQLFLFVHAVTDGAALIDLGIDAEHHQHSNQLSQSVLLHRMLFEVFLWKFFKDRYGIGWASLVFVNIAGGTILGFFAGQAIFSKVPESFGLFEAFMGGALFHLVYDYVKERFWKKHTHSHSHTVAQDVISKGP